MLKLNFILIYALFTTLNNMPASLAQEQREQSSFFQLRETNEDSESKRRRIHRLLKLPVENGVKEAHQKYAAPTEKQISDEIPQTQEINDNSPLYDVLFKFFSTRYQAIGNEEATKIYEANQNFSLGGQNFTGFTWELPFGHINISIDRQIAPDLFHDTRFIVSDEFKITIDAYAFLSAMKEDGSLDMSQTDMNLFAGMVFRRTYRNFHYANNFTEALFSDFSKLFLSFMRFKSSHLAQMSSDEVMIKEDFLSAHAGAMMTSPSYYGITGSLGGMAELKRIAKVSVHSLSSETSGDSGEFLRVSVEKDLNLKVGLMARIKGDFLNLLKLTLFSYDLSYDYSQAKRIHLSFSENERSLLQDESAQSQELNQFLRLTRFSAENLRSNIVSDEIKEKENWESRYGILLYSSLKKSATQLFHIRRGKMSQSFFRSHYESEKRIENPWTYMLGGLTKKLLNIEGLSVPDAKRSKELDLEIAISHEDISNEGKLDENYLIPSEEKVSLKFVHELFVRKTTGLLYRPYKKSALKQLDSWSNLTPQVRAHLEANTLRGPFTLKTVVRVEERGLRFMNQINLNSAYQLFVEICETKNKKIWIQESLRKKFLQWPQLDPRDQCVAQLGKKFEKYKIENNKTGALPFWSLRDFLISFHKSVKNKRFYKNLFGPDNIFIHGSLETQAKLEDSKHWFYTYFFDGFFRGLGLIENFKRSGGLSGDEWGNGL